METLLIKKFNWGKWRGCVRWDQVATWWRWGVEFYLWENKIGAKLRFVRFSCSSQASSSKSPYIHIFVIIFTTEQTWARSQTRLGFVRIQQIFLPLTQTWTHQHNLNCSPKQTSSESLISHICKVCSWSSSISPSLQTPLPRSNPIRTQKGGLRTYFRYTDKTSPQPT